MEQYQLRVIEEKIELEIKLRNLKAFLKDKKNDNISPEEGQLLLKQRDLMDSYSAVLSQRIEKF